MLLFVIRYALLFVVFVVFVVSCFVFVACPVVEVRFVCCACYLMFIVGCVVVCCWLCVVCCFLVVIGRSLFVVCCLFVVGCCLLLVACCLLPRCI